MSVSLQQPTRAATGTLLRAVLKLYALVTGANGVAFAVAAEPLGDWLGLPTALLVGVGAFLAGYAALVWLVATRPRVPEPAPGP